MSTIQILPGERRVQVLKLLAKHGPLSTRALSKILYPPIEGRALRLVLQRLKKAKLVRARFERIFGDRGVFHQIAQGQKEREEVALALHVTPVSLFQPDFRQRNLLHSESCALWAESFSRVLKNEKVIAEHHYSEDPIAKSVLLSEESHQSEFMPDLLISLPSQAKEDSVVIGVEVERTQKSDERIEAKLIKYAQKSLLDGVIYVCDQSVISDRVQLLYRSRVLNRVERIRHYEKNFFLVGIDAPPLDGSEPTLLNGEGKAVSITDWTRVLSRFSTSTRRDLSFGRRSSIGMPAMELLSH